MAIKTIEFIIGNYEKSINDKMMYYDYVFPTDEVVAYVDEINELSIDSIIESIKNYSEIEISAKDVFQFSSFEDCTTRLCDILEKENNPGVTCLTGGKLLLNDGKDRTDLAFTKYGENHLKTAELLRLAFSLSNTYFLSSLGMIYNHIPSDAQGKLLTRLVLRSRLVSRLIIAASKGRVNMRQALNMLSDSTYTRRKSNIKRVFNVLAESKEYNFSPLLENIYYPNTEKYRPLDDGRATLKVAENEMEYKKD